MNKIEECNAKNMRGLCELTQEDMSNFEVNKQRSDALWKEYEKLAKEMDDDDPRMEPGYHQYALDAHTKDIIRAKGMIAARDNLAKVASMIGGVLRQGDVVLKKEDT